MNIASILATKGGQVFTVGPVQTIRDALSRLAEHNVGALVVIDASGQPVGMLSERDVVRRLARHDTVLDETVESLMTTTLILGTPADDLVSVGQTMVEKHIRHLPVMDRGALVGLISIGDVVKAQRDHYQGEADTLQIVLLETQSAPGSER